jgi:hypothetical protein
MAFLVSQIAPFGLEWITTPTSGLPRLASTTSDDGAFLQIDDNRVIDLDGLHPAQTGEGRIQLDAGRHAMHLPYYEGTPYAVALSLWVRSPGEKEWNIFDLRNFEEPADKTQ